MIYDRPVPFNGSPEQARINFNSHNWARVGDLEGCLDCDCKPWYATSQYPCGFEPPREIVLTDGLSATVN